MSMLSWRRVFPEPLVHRRQVELQTLPPRCLDAEKHCQLRTASACRGGVGAQRPSQHDELVRLRFRIGEGGLEDAGVDAFRVGR